MTALSQLLEKAMKANCCDAFVWGQKVTTVRMPPSRNPLQGGNKQPMSGAGEDEADERGESEPFIPL